MPRERVTLARLVITPIARFAVRYAVPVLVGWAVVVLVLGLVALGAIGDGRTVEDKVQPSLQFVTGTESSHFPDGI